ncbi:MAG TPA: energy transducer TonB [Mucilaginibacter sp.]|jgi:hypothetical protein
MKIISVILALVLFGVKAHARIPIQTDSAITVLKAYMATTRYPAVAAENDVQGQMIITVTINKYNKIGVIEIVKPLSPECDSSVVQTLRKYSGEITLPAAKYTIGLHFVLVEAGKSEGKITPFDKSLSDDFLFELSITRFLKKVKNETSIDVIVIKKD